jgi:hypothetical protein
VSGIKENLKASGKLKIVLRGPDGKIKKEEHVNNLIVTVGKNWIASRMNDANLVMSHMAVGTGTTAAGATDTALETQLNSRVALTSTNVTGNEVEYIATFGTGGFVGAIAEAGIFNASTDGDMLARTVFPVVNKGTDDALTITWVVAIN